LDSVLRSSLYAHFSETLTGLPIIRAYREQKRFLRNNEAFLDIENRAYFLIICAQIWILIRLNTIANILYALQVCATLNWCIEQAAEVEANMNSMERLIHYSENLEVEAENIIPDNKPPHGWPACGEIHIKNLEIKYGPDGPPVLKDISVDIMTAGRLELLVELEVENQHWQHHSLDLLKQPLEVLLL
ncbi:44704_t:CDS:2, partial [Gigaspora margarita]